MADEVRVVAPEDRAEALHVVGTEITVLHSSPSGDVTFQRGDEGTGPPPHKHPWEECFYVLEGTIEFTCAGETSMCAPGTFVRVPAETVHTFRYGPGGASMLEFTGAGSKSASMFTAIDAETQPGPPDIPLLVGILERHGASVGA